MSAMDLDAVRAELREIADDVGEPNYRSDTEHFTSAWANVGRHVPALLAEVERLREHVRILECAVDGCRISCAQWERVAQDAMLRDGLTTAEVMRIERERDEAIAERDQLANRLADSVDPATIPAQQAAGWPDWHPEDYCHRCGRRNISWYTDSAVWNQVHGGSGPIWCPVCFVTAYEQTTGLRPSWRLAPADRSDETGALIRSEAAMRHERDEAIAERDRLRAELRRWESGQRRKGLPVVESVPDGLRYAAALVRAQGTEGGDEHDQLLVEAGMRLKALSDAASYLLAPRYAEVVAAARAWREMRRATPPKPTAAALIAAVDRLAGDDDG